MKRVIITLCACVVFLAALGICSAADDKSGKLNLNTVTKEQLVSAGVSSGQADAILELREENEAFVDIEELLDVEEMTPDLFRKLKKILFVEEVAGCNC